jgi:hypothetical protein
MRLFELTKPPPDYQQKPPLNSAIENEACSILFQLRPSLPPLYQREFDQTLGLIKSDECSRQLKHYRQRKLASLLHKALVARGIGLDSLII